MNDYFSIYSLTLQWLREHQIPHHAQSQIPSTNDAAKAEAFIVKDPVKIYLADEQSQGRGRGQNQWLNPSAGTSLLMTYSVLLNQAPQAVTGPLLGLSLFETLDTCFPGGGFSVKPPNDIYLAEKKVSGLLIEAVQQDQNHRLIVGIGLNVFSHPGAVDFAGHLGSDKKITGDVWQKFLSHFHSAILNSLPAIVNTHLNESQRQRLLQALNLYPLRRQKYVGVSPFGDLSTEEGVISWRDL